MDLLERQRGDANSSVETGVDFGWSVDLSLSSPHSTLNTAASAHSTLACIDLHADAFSAGTTLILHALRQCGGQCCPSILLQFWRAHARAKGFALLLTGSGQVHVVSQRLQSANASICPHGDSSSPSYLPA